jgi:uncharacterized protein (DUF1015 family)
MVDIRPFQGLRYSCGGADLAQRLAPPYDVIDEKEQEALLSLHPQNIVRLILGREYPRDDEHNNRYLRSAAHLEAWRDAGVLKRDEAPAYYLYEQTWNARGQKYRRLGFHGALALERFGQGGVYPHEFTLSAPKADRLRLLRATRVNLSPVFGLVPDADGELFGMLRDAMDRHPPAAGFEEPRAIHGRLWVMGDRDWCRDLSALMTERRVLIADGHHRYETALAYRDARILEDTGHAPGPDEETRAMREGLWPAYYRVMVVCVSTADPGLVVLPTHRVIHGVQGFSSAAFLAGLKKYFDVKPSTREDAAALTREEPHGLPRYGLAIGRDVYIVALKSPETLDLRLSARASPYRHLDVACLHALALEDLFGLTEEKLAAKTNVYYFKEAEEALDRARGPDVHAAFLLRPTPVDQVRACAEAGERMPQKSTFFYPKLASGIVMREAE